MAVEVRRYRREDADAVWSLHNRALEGTGAHLGNGAWDQDVRNPEAHYLDRGGEFLVATLGQRLVAMGAYIPTDEGVVEIKRMRVDPSVQRQGLGLRILAALEAEALAAGHRVAKLDTTLQQKAAQALYSSAGYRIVGSGKVGPFETVLFEKELHEQASA